MPYELDRALARVAEKTSAKFEEKIRSFLSLLPEDDKDSKTAIAYELESLCECAKDPYPVLNSAMGVILAYERNPRIALGIISDAAELLSKHFKDEEVIARMNAAVKNKENIERPEELIMFLKRKDQEL
ncbi:MAG: hypothetical protein ACP5GD_02735 [Candidatus Micrarchaeia archaeon]|jgi:hypothetical protein